MDKLILSIYLILGFFIMAGYTRLIKNFNNNHLWSNDNTNRIASKCKIRVIYTLMILLSVISGCYLVHYLTYYQKNDTVNYLVYIGSIIFLSFSLIWAYFPLSKPKWIVKMSLGLVAVGAILILSGLSLNVHNGYNTTEDKLALASIIILVIQTTFFDFLLWNGFV